MNCNALTLSGTSNGAENAVLRIEDFMSSVNLTGDFRNNVGGSLDMSNGSGSTGVFVLSGNWYSNGLESDFKEEGSNVIFTGVGIVSATATAVISAAGSITAIRITNAGLGYTQTPTVRIVNPNLTGSGTYEFNEVVTGSISGTTARVKSWSAVNNKLEVSTVSGEFLVGENIVGAASSAYYMLNSVNDDPIADGYADNSQIEIEADKIVDFSEKNPFGMP
jgi:hypothetical protein